MPVKQAFLGSPETFGDQNFRDVYARTAHLRADGPVTTAHYTRSAGSAINTVSMLSSYVSGSTSGSLQVFVKGSGSSLNTASDTPLMTLAPTQTTLTSTNVRTTGSLSVQDVTVAQASTNLNLTLPANNSVTSFRFLNGSNNPLLTIANTGAVNVTGVLTAADNILATADLYVTGDTSLYGNFAVDGSVQVNSKTVLVGATASDRTDAGLYVGASTGSALAALQYAPTGSFASAASWKTTVPLVFVGGSTTAEVGTNGQVLVYSNDKTTSVKVDSSSVNFNDLWRLRYDSGNQRMVIEYRVNTGASYNVMFEVRAP